MKKRMLCMVGACMLLGATLASCSNNEVDLNDAESRNLRLASGINLFGVNSANKVNKAFNAESVSSEVTLALPSLDILINNDFKIDSKVEGEEGEEKFVYEGANYTFKETISFKNNNDETKEIVIYYNYMNNLNDNKEYTEAIEGVVAIDGSSHLDFTSTAYLENKHSNRELSLYLGENKDTSLVIKEETKVDGEESYHLFDYSFKLNGVSLVSYSINLNKDNPVMTLSVLTFSLKVTCNYSSNTWKYNVEVSEELTSTTFSLTFEKTIENGSANYSLVANLN